MNDPFKVEKSSESQREMNRDGCSHLETTLLIFFLFMHATRQGYNTTP